MPLDKFVSMYLDYRNNFLTIEVIATHYRLPLESAVFIVSTGRLITGYELKYS